MKTRTALFTLTFLFLLSSYTFSQETNSQNAIDTILANATEASVYIYFAYDLDVLNYFGLSGYDTELKRQVFKKSSEYAERLEELRTIKSKMFRTTYYLKVEGKFNDELNRADYDIKGRGFGLELGKNWGMGTSSARTPKSIDLPSWGVIHIKALPTRHDSNVEGLYTEQLFLSMNETLGLEIENNRENVDLYLFFTPSGREQTIFKYYNGDHKPYKDKEIGWCTITHNDIKADTVRIVVTNRLTGRIYFDKTYSDLSQPHTK